MSAFEVSEWGVLFCSEDKPYSDNCHHSFQKFFRERDLVAEHDVVMVSNQDEGEKENGPHILVSGLVDVKRKRSIQKNLRNPDR